MCWLYCHFAGLPTPSSIAPWKSDMTFALPAIASIPGSQSRSYYAKVRTRNHGVQWNLLGLRARPFLFAKLWELWEVDWSKDSEWNPLLQTFFAAVNIKVSSFICIYLYLYSNVLIPIFPKILLVTDVKLNYDVRNRVNFLLQDMSK